MIEDREAWRAQVQALCRSPRGSRTAVRAVVKWCLQSADDKRMRHVIEDARPELIARALIAGGWSGAGLGDLVDALDDGGQVLVEKYLLARGS